MLEMQGYNLFIKNALKYGFSLFGLPKTNALHSEIANDDADLQKGYPVSGDRFTNNGDGTITDNATGLMWVSDPSQLGGVFGTPGTPARSDWYTFNEAILNKEYAGYSDWRMPNFFELTSIVNCGDGSFSFYSDFFVMKTDYHYFSSTIFANFYGACFGIRFNAGFGAFVFVDSPYYTMLCRGGV